MRSDDTFRRSLAISSLSATLLLTSCEALIDGLPAVGTFFGNILVAAANNYAPGHGEAVKALVTALSSNDDSAEAAEAHPEAPPLGLDVALLKQTTVGGREVLESLEDGDVLRDGRGDLHAGDKFRIAFRASQDCFLYILGIDATGWVTPLLPSGHSRHSNSIQKGRDYQLPDPEYAYTLNQHRGIEHVYFVVSEAPRPDIESLLEAFEGQEQPPPKARVRVSEEQVAPRGFDKKSIGLDLIVESAFGSHDVTPAAFSNESGNDLIVTRWFRHQ